MRPRLLELPDAPLLAMAAAILVLLYTFYRAFILSGQGWRKVAPTVIGGLVIAAVLIKVVAFGDAFQDEGVPIFSYGFMIMLGFAGVILISALRGKVFGLDSNHIMDLGLFAMLGGIVGARVWHYLQYNKDYTSFFQIFQIWRGGIVFYGGLIGGFICCTAYIVKHKLNYWAVSEVVGPAMPIGIAFARLGCFLNGCCFGGTCPPDAFGAVRFPAHPMGDPGHQSPAFVHQVAEGLVSPTADWSLWVYPAQLFASFGAMVIFGLLMAYSRFIARKPGESFFMLLVLYAPLRFWMEMFRNDTPEVWAGMTAGQVTGIPLVIVGLLGVLWVRFGNPPHMEGLEMINGRVKDAAQPADAAKPAASDAPASPDDAAKPADAPPEPPAE